jgi:hypothetical protein
VNVIASGNTISFRLAHKEASRFKDEVARLLLAYGTPVQAAPAARQPPPQPSAPSLTAQLRELADLRDAGILTEDEFQDQKAKLLR